VQDADAILIWMVKSLYPVYVSVEFHGKSAWKFRNSHDDASEGRERFSSCAVQQMNLHVCDLVLG
jgi:hypothetical protein